MQYLRETAKRSAGWLVARSNRRAHYRNCVLILAHMRCGSTALSNILCSRDDTSGYGETHVRHDGSSALGRLVINQRRRGAWKPEAHYLFDKILHNRHDDRAPPAFFQARAIFIVRRPGDAIRSIVDLYARLGRTEYATHEQAAAYYVERLKSLEEMWARFPADRRIGLTHESLLARPDETLGEISLRLGIKPALANHYISPAASQIGGGGDPLVSAKHNRIIPDATILARADGAVSAPSVLIEAANESYLRTSSLFAS